MPHHVHILRCADGSYYIGTTQDLASRETTRARAVTSPEHLLSSPPNGWSPERENERQREMQTTSGRRAGGLAAVVALLAALGFLATGGTRAESKNENGAALRSPAHLALAEALSTLEAKRGDEGLLVLTNAGYAAANGKCTAGFIETAAEVTGCSSGNGSLHVLHTRMTAPLWFAVTRRDAARMVFCVRTEDAFERQVFNATPELLSRAEERKKVAAGPVGSTLFRLVSFRNAWAQGADWELLKCAEFHNHCCGGVSAGYLAGKHIQAHFPLRARERYVFVTASPSCAMDALQVMFDATTGKKGMFSSRADTSAYEVDGARPLTIVLRVNDDADRCEGILLGFAWEKTGQTSKLWNLEEVKQRNCVRELKRFSGTASLARSLMETGADPYALIWKKK